MARNANSTTPPRTGLDPTFDVDALPRVGANQSLWPIVFGIVAALALGAIVFLQMAASRTADAAPLPQAPPPPVVEEPVVPVEPPPAPALQPTPMIDLQPPPPAEPEGPSQAEIERLRAPAVVVDLGQYEAPGSDVSPGGLVKDGESLDAGAISESMTGAANAGASMNADERFAQRFGVGSNAKPARAKAMGDLSTRIIEGAVIPAVLETALNSDLPGYTRAVVTRDVRGFDGSLVLVPRGSRLIGQYRSGVALGQSRAFVIWTRLIRPDGATIDLAAPATDGLGRGGLHGKVDRHFLQRFGGAILLSLLNIGGQAVADSSDTSVVIASTRAGTDAAGVALATDTKIGPTVKVPQGSPVRVFVSQDLDFSSVGPAEPTDPVN